MANTDYTDLDNWYDNRDVYQLPRDARDGSDVLDEMIRLEQVKGPTKGKEFLNNFLIALNKEAGNEPGQLPSIQSAQTDAGQFDLQAPNPGAAQPNKAIYNPFAGQYYIDENGRKIERNPTNSSLRTGP